MGAAEEGGSGPTACNTEPADAHTSCPFSGRAVCRCIYGSSLAAPVGAAAQQQGEQREQPSAAAADAATAAAMGRLLQPPNASWEPVAVMLPKLVRQDPAATGGAHPSAAMAAAEARLEQAEAVARSAALQAASLAAAAGLAYQAPNGVAVDVSGVVQADLSELERRVEAVRRAQEARQQAAAAAAMAAAVQQGPTVMPLASLMGGGLLQPGLGGSKVPEGALDVPVPPAGRLVRQSRSLDPAAGVVASALAQGALSMPLPSTSSGGAAAVAAPGRSSRARGKPASKPSPHEGSGAGPGKGSRAGSKQARVVHRNGQSPASADRPGPPPDLAPFGAGYTPRGPSAATPPKSWMLKLKDLKPALRGHLVQTFWPDGGCWWPAVVVNVSVADRSVSLFYETGDDETVDFTRLVHAGELAWLRGPQASPAGGAEAGSKRRQASGVQSPSLQSRSSGQQGQGQGSVPPSSGRTKRQRSGPKSLPDAAQQQQQRQPFVAGLPSEGTSSGLMAVSGGSFGEPDAQLQQRPGRLEWQDEFGDGALPSPGDLLDATQDGSDGNGQLLPPLLPSLGGSSLGGGAMHLTGRGSELLLVDTSMLGEQLPSNFLDSPRQQAQAAQAAPMQAAAAPAAAPEAAPAEASPSLPAAAQLVEADAEPQAMEADPQPAEMQQREEQLPPEPTVQQGAAAEPGQKELQAVPVLEPRPEFVQQEGRAAGSEPSAGEPAASPDPGGQPAETAADSVDLAAEPAAVEAPTGGADDAAAAAEEVTKPGGEQQQQEQQQQQHHHQLQEQAQPLLPQPPQEQEHRQEEDGQPPPPQQEGQPLQPQPSGPLPQGFDGLPPVLAMAAAHIPAGHRVACLSQFLDLGEAAVGRPLLVCTLSSGGWQQALVRQSSARHGLMQVQIGEQGLLLAAQEEGQGFLVGLPA